MEANHNEVRFDCPLCRGGAEFLTNAAKRPIWACPYCRLRFVPAAFHLPLEQEKARYGLHRNTREDQGYVRMLMEAVDLFKELSPGRAASPTVLDFGCGPAPVLVDLLREAGFLATGYDPFFAPATDLSHGYDAVVSTETFEHFRRPREDVGQAVSLVKPGGLLVVMTAWHDSVGDLATWHYALDATHVAFYSRGTFDFIARQWNLRIRAHNGRNLVALERRPGWCPSA